MKIPFEQFAYAVWVGIAEAVRIVRLSPGTGTGQISLTAGAVTVGTNNDKTGYALTAGSYSVRASSTQRGTIVLNTSTSGTATISSVTTTRAQETFGGYDTNVDLLSNSAIYITLTNATTVTATKSGGAAGVVVVSYVVPELF